MARTKKAARKHAPHKPARYHYESDHEVRQQHPPPQPIRRRINTARKSAPSEPAQYHYATDSGSGSDSDSDSDSSDSSSPREDVPPQQEQARQQDQGRPYTTKQTARKASSWQPARYHYPSDDEPGPVNHKRRLADESSEDDEADIDLRPAKRLHSTPPALLTEHADPQEEIKALRAHIDELHAFIQTSGVLLKAPPSIRQQIDAREDGAAALAAAIKTAISKAIEDLEPDDWQSHHDDVNGDDVSAAVLPFIEHIRGLSNFPHADSISLAMELLVYLVDSSYGELDTHVGCGNGDRPSDAPADDLFCYLARRRAKQEPSWDYTPMLKRLESVSQGPFEFGIETPFTKTVAMMRKWRMTIVID